MAQLTQPTVHQQVLAPEMSTAVQYQQPCGQQTATASQAQLALQQQALLMQQNVQQMANTQQIYDPRISAVASTAAAFAQPVVAPISSPATQVTNPYTATATDTNQKVFTGIITKVHGTYGFVDEEVFFQLSVVKGPAPVVNDRVLVDAVCLPNMPFKWNATRIEVLSVNDAPWKNNKKGLMSLQTVSTRQGRAVLGRLSGAQKKKLVKERKMKEGTWVPRIRSSVRKNGGRQPEKAASPVRERQLDSELDSTFENLPLSNLDKKMDFEKFLKNFYPITPEKTVKRYRSLQQTVATLGFKIVIYNGSPDEPMTRHEIDLLRRKLTELVLTGNSSDQDKQFHNTKIEQGMLWLTCANEETKNWLCKTVDQLEPLWPNSRLHAVDAKNLPKRPKMYTWVQSKEKPSDILRQIQKQNTELRTDSWKIISSSTRGDGQFLCISIDEGSFKHLRDNLKFQAFWALGKINIRPYQPKKGSDSNVDFCISVPVKNKTPPICECCDSNGKPSGRRRKCINS